MAFSFQVGMSFPDNDTLEKNLKEFEQQHFVKLCKSDCRKIKAASVRCPEKSFKDSIVYSDLKYSCSQESLQIQIKRRKAKSINS